MGEKEIKMKIAGKGGVLLKRVLPVMLLLALLAAIFPASTDAVSAAANGFSDLGEGHWARPAVAKLVEKGIINGYPDGTFRPASKVTYGEFIKMSCLTAGLKAEKKQGSAAGENWAKTYYDAALNAGILDGERIDAGLLSLEIPRKHMAYITAGVLRAAEKLPEIADDSDARFSDMTPTAENAYDISLASSAGILTGYPDGTFMPDGTLTRAEASASISRLLQYLGEAKVEGTPKTPAPDEPQTPLQEDPNAPTSGDASEREDMEYSGTLKRKVELANGKTEILEYHIISTTAKEMGIKKIEPAGKTMLKIYSSVEYPLLMLMKENGQIIPSIGFPDGEYYVDDGLYVYAANLKKENREDLSGAPVYLLTEDLGNEVYFIRDMTL